MDVERAHVSACMNWIQIAECNRERERERENERARARERERERERKDSIHGIYTRSRVPRYRWGRGTPSGSSSEINAGGVVGFALDH